MRRPRLARWLLGLLALPCLGCLEDRLSVDITTYVHPDGSCLRRVEYRFERADGDFGKTIDIAPGTDPLRLFHSFPQGERWSVKDDLRAALHTVSAEARLDSPNDLDWDFMRRRAQAAAPARNYVSFSMSGEPNAVLYDYAETFVDPASPLEGARSLARLLLKRDDDFAARVAEALGPAAPRPAEVKRAYREHFAQPLARDVEALVARPIYGPRERRELQGLLERIDRLETDLQSALVALSPVATPDEIKQQLEGMRDDFGEGIQNDLQSSGQPLPFELAEPISKIRFKVTLVMPSAITRANACVQGDTAVWEFDQDDLFGRGFEMWAKAGGR